MEKFRKIIYLTICIIAVLVAVCSLLSIFRNTESKFLKMLDFPRIQFFITSAISLILFLIFTKRWKWYDYLLVLALIGGLIVNGSYLINYTTLVEEAVSSAEQSQIMPNNQISILLANVKMTNRDAQPIIDLISEKNPDIIIAMEIDQWWENQIEAIEKKYPYRQETINNVTYGMTLYSKYRLENINVNYLNNHKVPSFESIIQLKNNKYFHLYSMHPVPPTRFKELPDNAGQQEKAMKKLGNMAENRKYPVIVAGDLNDVSWGDTDKLTETKNLLHDVRVGRGFYNSYHTDYLLMRWPLDHIFVTNEFKLVELKRLQSIGSDHFPIFAKFVL